MADVEAANVHDPRPTTLIMIALCTTMFIVSLDTFTMTTALPAIAVDLNASDADYAWIGSSYMLAFGVVVPMWANISNNSGRRQIFIVTNIFFLIGILIGAFSRSAPMLIAGRTVQGVGGGGLAVLVNLTVGDLFDIK